MNFLCKNKLYAKRVLFNVLAIIAIYFLIYKFNLLNFPHLSFNNFHVKSFVIVFFVIFFSSLRFLLIAKKFDLKLNYLKALKVTSLSGLFFFILPGSIGAEVSRYFLLKKDDISKSSIVAVILIDRLFALFSQLLIVATILLSLLYHKKYFFVLYLILIAFLCLLIIFFATLKMPDFLVRKLKKLKLYNVATKIKKYFSGNLLHLFSMLFFSVSVNFFLVASIYLIINEQFLSHFNFFKIALITISSNIVSVIPVTPGGAGTSEYFFNFLGNQVNLEDMHWVTAAYIILRLITFLANGIIFSLASLYSQIFKNA